MGNVTVITHPLVQHKLTLMRDKNCGTKDFRQLLEEISMLMAYEVTRSLPLEEVEIETPICKCKSKVISGKKIALVTILRSGIGMANGALRLIPSAKVGHIGSYRDPKTLQPVDYYCKLPNDIDRRDAFVLDPMLATGGKALAAIRELKNRGVERIKVICILAVPESIKAIQDAFPDVDIYCASIDEGITPEGYIVPGMGDAGDRMFGTK